MFKTMFRDGSHLGFLIATKNNRGRPLGLSYLPVKFRDDCMSRSRLTVRQRGAGKHTKWLLVAILDFGSCLKTIGVFLEAGPTIPENFVSIASGVFKLRSGNETAEEKK